MKKIAVILSFVLVLVMAVTAVGAGVTVKLNGEAIDTRDANGNEVAPFIEDGTTYVPVRAVAAALGIAIDWDGDTRTVIIGDKGEAAPELGENVNIYINGIKFNPTDANGKAVYPIIKDGTSYLPVRAVAQAFARKVDWDAESSSVLISDSARVDEDKTYKIVLHGTSSVIVPSGDGSGSSLKTAVFTGAENEIWKFVPVEGQDGFYQIINVKSGCAMDVNGASRSAGAKLLQYTAGSGENQRFMLVAQDNGSYKIISKNSMLPIEASAGEVKQNDERGSSVQEWDIVEAEAAELDESVTYNALKVMNGSAALTYSVDGTALNAEFFSGLDTQKWSLVPEASGCYAINTKDGGKSIDVANNSTDEGDPIITYTSSTDDNQRWIFEKQESGGYKIKSVSSGLYLTAGSDGSVVQTAEGTVFEVSDAK